MHGEPVRYSKPPVEAKVKWAAFGSYIGSTAALAVLQAIDADRSLIAFWPDWLEAVTLPLLPTAISAVLGFRAKHTARPDLPANQR
jgi:hypothetical protein